MLSYSVMFNSLRSHGLQPARLLCPWRFSRQECWNGLLYPPPGDLPDLGIEPMSLASPVLAGRFFTTSATWDFWNVFPNNICQEQLHCDPHLSSSSVQASAPRGQGSLLPPVPRAGATPLAGLGLTKILNQGDLGLVPGLWRCPREGNGNPL